MKKLLAVSLFCGMIGLCADHVIIGKGKFDHFNHYGNAEIVRQKDILLVRFGGCNAEKGGAMQIFRNALTVPADDDSNALTVTMKGDGSNGRFVILCTDHAGKTWCWNGQRWMDSAQISVLDDTWHKKVFPAKDFVQLTPVPAKEERNVLNLREIRNLQLAIGPNLTAPEKRLLSMEIAEIAMEKNPVAGPVKKDSVAAAGQKKTDGVKKK